MVLYSPSSPNLRPAVVREPGRALGTVPLPVGANSRPSDALIVSLLDPTGPMTDTTFGSPWGIGRMLVLAVLLSSFAPAASGQVDVRVGFKEGGNFATLGGADGTQATAPGQTGASLSRRPGLIIGGLVEFKTKAPVGVQSELLWIWKGAKGLAGDKEAVTKVNYVEVPLLASYQSPVTVGPVTTHLLAGPTVALSTQAQRELSSTDGRFLSRTPLDGPARNLELGLAVGAEAEYPFSDRASLRMGLRYRRGLTRVFGDDVDGAQTSAIDAWHSGLAITLGFVYSSGWSFSVE